MDDQIIHTLWGHLHWLGVLAQQGSYTAAAARLGVSKAAMSQRVSELEKLAGVPLVQRTTRSVRLTEAGQRLVDDTKAPFDAIAHSFASVRDLAGTPRGLLRLTAPVALARQQLVPRLATFLQQYPEVRLELDMSDRMASLAMEGWTWPSATATTCPKPMWPGTCAPPTQCWWPAPPTWPGAAPPATPKTCASTIACTTHAAATHPPGPSRRPPWRSLAARACLANG